MAEFDDGQGEWSEAVPDAEREDEGAEGALDALSALMAEPDAGATFEFAFADPLAADERLVLRLRGQRRELGQTLACTGETIWRASEVSACSLSLSLSLRLLRLRIC